MTSLYKYLLINLFCSYFSVISFFTTFNSNFLYSVKSFITSFVAMQIFTALLCILHGKLYRIVLCLFAIIWAIIGNIYLYYTFVYAIPISNEGYFIIFNSMNTGYLYENYSWLKSNFNIYYILTCFLSTIAFVLLYNIIKKINKKNNTNIAAFIVCIGILSTGLIRWGTFEETFSKYPITAIYIQHKRYVLALEDFKRISDEIKNINVQATYDNPSTDTPPLFVLVIGESLTKHHMGLYGYERNTNPLLSKALNLHIFNDVTSTSCSTVTSLLDSLTLKKNGAFSASLVDIFNAAGFNTVYISNHTMFGAHDNFSTYIFGNAKETFPFLKYGTYVQPDGIILDRIDEVIKEITKPTLLIIHIFGSHTDFIDRYPSEYGLFSGNEIANKPHIPGSKKIYAAHRINTYDNSVLYNDYIISSIIAKLSEKKRYSYLLYFSDHGEENYEFRDYFGRGGDNSYLVYDIPVLLWTSEAFTNIHSAKLQNEKFKRKLTLENLSYTLFDLSSIHSELFSLEKSFLSDRFDYTPRLADGKPYEDVPR